MEVADWLHELGLGQYAPAFADNDIGWDLLADLSADELKELGVASLGHRRRLLAAIAALRAGDGAGASAAARPVRDDASAPPAERRQVTVMFCDLVGSTALSAALDPEDLREVIGRYHGCVAETVRRFDGFVAKYMGDGVLVYFGYPHAHEDDAEQAVRAGLALVEAVAALTPSLSRERERGPRDSLSREAGEGRGEGKLQARIGIASGLVVVGDLIGAGSAQEQAIVGETPNLAARLQALAEPNAIVVAESTRRQIGALFEVADLGPQSLKGFAAPQPAWRVIAENRALGRFEALRSGTTPLVGRDEELELLLRRWAQANAGSGRVVLISGEPGVGKSRLAEALLERIAAEPHIRLRYFCSPHHQDSALYPIIVAQMERASRFARDDAPRTKLAKLRALLEATGTPTEDVALIVELHSLPPENILPPLDMTPQRKKQKTFEALLRHLERLSQRQPVLMVFEDIHWIDPSSRELLDAAIERLRDWPVLLLATFRPEFQPPWAGQSHVAMLTLARLDRRDAAAMVENIAGNRSLPADIVHEIAERTDGVPLFVEELTKAVLESGAQGAAALSSVPHPALSVPATLHASLMARLDRLGPTAKDVAQKGAVIGREFGYELLALITDLPESQLREALDKLTDSGLLFARGTPPNAAYVFKHALVQDAAYGTLLRTRRQQLHARIGGVLEAQIPETSKSQPELLAHHFTEAGSTQRAVEYWLKAGQQALARSAMVEAEALLRKGLNHLLTLPDSVWRQQYELDLQIALGWALTATQGYASSPTGEAYARAHRLCKELNHPERLLPILLCQWNNRINAADLQRAGQFAAEMQQVGEARDDVITQVMAYRASGFTSLMRGDVASARSYLERGLALYDPAQRSSYAELEPHETMVIMLIHSAAASACCGYIDQARLRQNAALAEARRLSHSLTLAGALFWACSAGVFARSEPRILLQYADELLALSAERRFPVWRVLAAWLRGWCLAALGHAADGIALLATALSDLRAMGSNPGTVGCLTLLADAYRMAGQREAALTNLSEADRLAEAAQMRLGRPDRFRLRGDLLMQSGDLDAAEASFHDAIALAQGQGAKLFELRAATSLGRLWRDQGKCTEASDLLAPVHAWFSEGFDAPDLVEAKALLAELAA